MSCENDMCELGGLIDDAAECLRRAAALALRLTCDGDPDESSEGWPAMNALIDRLDALNLTLADLVGPEILQAIHQSQEYLDDMADRADGISY